MYSLTLGSCLRSLKDGYPQIEGYSNLLEIAQDGGNYDLVQLFIQYGEDLNCIVSLFFLISFKYANP